MNPIQSGTQAILAISAFFLFQAQLPFEKLVEKTLREPNPFSFISLNPFVDLSEQDFELPFQDATWIPGSFQWVRVGNGRDEAGILIPRARYRKDGKEVQAALTLVDNPLSLKFRPRAELKTRSYFDSSCSPFRLQLNEAKLSKSWVMITCHPINNEVENGTKTALLATVLWENDSKGRLTQILLDADSPKHRFTGESGDSFELEAKVAPRFKHLGVSLGVGPYSNRDVLKPFVTVYASYFLNDAFKVVSFGAFPIRPGAEIDWGGYMVMEQFRGFDERISLNLLLGAHLLSYVPAGQSRANAFSGPQGIEMTFRDFLFSRMNLFMGGFFYPKINGRSYVNSWIRYGTSQYFIELNYIDWQEPEPYFRSKSAGLSVGFPLFRAF